MIRCGLMLLLCCATPALAQSLEFIGAPTGQNLGIVSSAMTVRRLNASAQPITTGNQTVMLTGSSNRVEFSLNGSLTMSWSSSLNITIANGSSSSPTFYFRSGVPGTVTLNGRTNGFTTALASVAISRTVIADSSESGSVYTTQTPPGEWNSSWLPSTLNTLDTSMAAAHRGLWGLRVIDIESITDAGGQNAAYTESAAVVGDMFYRTWFRMTSTNGLGSYVLGQLAKATTSSPNLVEVAVYGSTGQLVVEGFNDGPTIFQVALDAGVNVGQWHLIEFAAIGAGTNTAGRGVWLDGKEIFSQSGIRWSQYPFERATVGEAWSNDRRFTGQLDFDDTRVTAQEPPSKIQLIPPGASLQVGACVPVEVILTGSRGTMRLPAPYTFSAPVVTTGLQAFGDALCGVPIATLDVLSDTTTRTLYVRAPQAGTATLSVSYVDFLSTPLTFVASGDGGVVTLDAGVRLDGGTGLLPDGGLAAPVFITVPADSVNCGETWSYQPQVVSRLPVTWQLRVDGDAGSSEWVFDASSGSVQRVVSKVAPFTHQLTLSAQSGAGTAVQDFTVQTVCPELKLGVGCGCAHASPGTLLWAAGLLLLFVSRRRSSGER